MFIISYTFFFTHIFIAAIIISALEVFHPGSTHFPRPRQVVEADVMPKPTQRQLLRPCRAGSRNNDGPPPW